MDLSVVIPARNEMWLSHTVEDAIRNSGDGTEVIVVLDGAWPEVGYELKQHPRVNVIYLPTAIGQRAATNLGVRVSEAEFVMKADAHVSFDSGFDRKLIDAARDLGPGVTQIPTQFNLHIFDRICACGKREYQGPMTVPCVACGQTNWTRELVWKPRLSRKATAWRFDGELHFNYWGDFTRRPEGQGEIHDTMSCLGACWFLSRERYWEIGGLDEKHGSWGQMGTELACKAWLSGGRMVTNERTWFAHLFRTQGHDFSFPYPITGAEQEHARQYSRTLWRGNGWNKQVKSLRWLVEKFAPVPGWSQEQIDALPSLTKGIVYYSDCRGDAAVLEASRRSIERSGLPIVAVTLKPIDWLSAQNVVLPLERGYLAMFKQILAGLEALDTDIAFLCEHDVLYTPEHFAFTPPRNDTYYYNQHVWKVDALSGHALHYRCSQTSGLCANRQLLVEHYRKRVAHVEQHGFSRAMGFEPGTHNRTERVDDFKSETWMSSVPNIDIRHGHNLTPSRWRREQFKNQKFTEGWTESDRVPGWGVTEGRFREFLREVNGAVEAVA